MQFDLIYNCKYFLIDLMDTNGLRETVEVAENKQLGGLRFQTGTTKSAFKLEE